MISLQRISRACPWLSVLVVLMASFLIVRQELNYNQTFDESTHLAAGMEWLTLGTYTYDLLHPPLARVAVALPLRFTGERSEGHHSEAVEGTALLNGHSAYVHDLLITRLGIMPFFVLANLILFLWMKRHFDSIRALLAVVLFSFCPAVLAHSALATTDLAFSAMYLLSILAFAHMFRVRTSLGGCFAGLAFGLAILTKYTQLPFFFIAILLLLVWRLCSGERLRGLAGPLLVACATACFVIWAGFRFSFGPLFPADTFNVQTHSTLTTLKPAEQLFLLKLKVPAPPFFRGLIYAFRVGGTNTVGHYSYVLHHVYKGGKWYFFPVVLLAKTPIALILLAAVGLWYLLRHRRLTVETVVLICAIAAPLIVAMLGNVNLGVRHVLPIFPFVAMLGAVGAGVLAQDGRSLSQATALHFGPRMFLSGVLIAWEVVAAFVAAPQFLPYFNEVAEPFFGSVAVESDLDWGQDLYHLENRMRGIDPSQVSLGYFGDPSILRHASAAWRKPDVDRKPNEWVAVSETEFRLHPGEYAWLDGLAFERIGESIRLYHLNNDSLRFISPARPSQDVGKYH